MTLGALVAIVSPFMVLDALHSAGTLEEIPGVAIDGGSVLGPMLIVNVVRYGLSRLGPWGRGPRSRG